MEDKNSNSTYKTCSTNEDVNFCKQLEGNTQPPTIDDADRRGSNSSKVSSCEQTTYDALSPTIAGTGIKRFKASEVSSFEQVRTSSNNIEGGISSEGLNSSYDRVRNVQSKYLDLDNSCNVMK